ncbi:hypothetical protein ACFQFC_22020 [Amorphoplanes digitatis]|uniref:Uncharacterized protein n=1 Tax=Actinoplanes digitatis TaxID=1868 RepID=A0A7W7MTY6_9ACTN|nr:hypothetical protein [Actinoplanes digitatis]MBB4766896.1 hypothetical protein [Actinoplanes digitatis]GID97753.1 hypothetical protein Adi01nite_71650 [Actinoplanes digitatis]
MSINKTDDAVAEYLQELESRLSGLPVLQRRELLADLEAHITSERIERAVVSEGEVLEILERLGSPEVVAAAAYEEAGLLQPAGAAAGRRLPPVPPPPDEPVFRGPAAPPPYAAPPPFSAPPPFVGPPVSPPPFIGHSPTKGQTGTGARVAIAVAIVAAVFIALGCLVGSLALSRGAEAPEPMTGIAPEPAVTAPLHDEVDLPD